MQSDHLMLPSWLMTHSLPETMSCKLTNTSVIPLLLCRKHAGCFQILCAKAKLNGFFFYYFKRQLSTYQMSNVHVLSVRASAVSINTRTIS